MNNRKLKIKIFSILALILITMNFTPIGVINTEAKSSSSRSSSSRSSSGSRSSSSRSSSTRNSTKSSRSNSASKNNSNNSNSSSTKNSKDSTSSNKGTTNTTGSKDTNSTVKTNKKTKSGKTVTTKKPSPNVTNHYNNYNSFPSYYNDGSFLRTYLWYSIIFDVDDSKTQSQVDQIVSENQEIVDILNVFAHYEEGLCNSLSSEEADKTITTEDGETVIIGDYCKANY